MLGLGGRSHDISDELTGAPTVRVEQRERDAYIQL